MSAKERFLVLKSKSWKLTDPQDPAQVKMDYLNWFAEMFETAKRWFKEEHGYDAPEKILTACEDGDWSDSASYLRSCKDALEDAMRFVRSIENHTGYGYQSGGLGYLLAGVPWQKIPAMTQEYLRTRFVEGVTL